MATDGSASAASEIEVGSISIYRTMQELRAAAAKQADTCVAGDAWRGMWRVEEVSPHVGIRIGGIGWSYGGSVIGQKTTKTSREDTSGVPGLYPAKTGTTRSRPLEGLVGCAFFLTLVRTRVPVFWPQTDKVYKYVFLAAALFEKFETLFSKTCAHIIASGYKHLWRVSLKF